LWGVGCRDFNNLINCRYCRYQMQIK
jgi:hypothetical protein